MRCSATLTKFLFSTCPTSLFYESHFESFISILQLSLFDLSDQHSCYVDNRVRIQRTDVCYIADGLEESETNIEEAGGSTGIPCFIMLRKYCAFYK